MLRWAWKWHKNVSHGFHSLIPLLRFQLGLITAGEYVVTFVSEHPPGRGGGGGRNIPQVDV